VFVFRYSSEAKRPLEGGPLFRQSRLSLEKIVFVDHAAYRPPYGGRRMIWNFLAFNRPGSDLLSRVLRRSTIGAGAFHGRVRNGNGCSHPAITTRSTKGKNCAGDSAKPNEKLVEVFTSFVLNTFFTMIFALGFDRSRKASQAQSASPVVWRAVRSAAALRRQREDKTRLLMLIFDEQ
jgi:hypothetical protein